LAKDRFPFDGQPERPGLGALLLSLLFEAQFGLRRPEQESELGVLRGSVQERLDLHASAGPVVVVHQGGHEVGSHFEASLVLGQEGPIDSDLILRSGANSEGRGKPQTSFDVVGPAGENLLEDSFPVVDQAEAQQRSPQPNLGRHVFRFHRRSLTIKSQGQRRDAPIQPRPGATHHLVQLLGARKEAAGSRRDGPRLLSEVCLETELAGELEEAVPLHDRSAAPQDLGRDGEGQAAGSEDHQARGDFLPVSDEPADGVERHPVRVL
jgi:hypothetical protein